MQTRVAHVRKQWPELAVAGAVGGVTFADSFFQFRKQCVFVSGALLDWCRPFDFITHAVRAEIVVRISNVRDQLSESAHRVHRTIAIFVCGNHFRGFRYPVVDFVEAVAQLSRDVGSFLRR